MNTRKQESYIIFILHPFPFTYTHQKNQDKTQQAAINHTRDVYYYERNATLNSLLASTSLPYFQHCLQNFSFIMQELGVFLQTVNFNKLKKISTFENAPTKICPAYSLNKTE